LGVLRLDLADPAGREAVDGNAWIGRALAPVEVDRRVDARQPEVLQLRIGEVVGDQPRARAGDGGQHHARLQALHVLLLSFLLPMSAGPTSHALSESDDANVQDAKTDP